MALVISVLFDLLLIYWLLFSRSRIIRPWTFHLPVNSPTLPG